MRKLALLMLVAGAISLPAGLEAKKGDSPGVDKDFLGVETHKGRYLDQEYVAPGASLSGKTIHVEKFEFKGEHPKKEKGDLDSADLPEFMQEVLVEYGGEHSGGAKLSKSSGSYKLMGEVLEFRPPSEGASWGGWIGEAAGSGTIVFDFKIVDSSGKVVAAGHHKLIATASDSLKYKMQRVASDGFSRFLASVGK
jgi:hypothetical protein